MVKVKLLATKGCAKEFETIVSDFLSDKKNYKVSHDISVNPDDLTTTFTALVLYE